MDGLQKIDACQAEIPTTLLHSMNNVTTPLDWREWEAALVDNPDKRFKDYITPPWVLRRGRLCMSIMPLLKKELTVHN